MNNLALELSRVNGLRGKLRSRPPFTADPAPPSEKVLLRSPKYRTCPEAPALDVRGPSCLSGAFAGSDS